MIKSAVVMLLLFFFGVQSKAFGESGDAFTGGVPLEIYQLMRKKQCSPIKGFYDRLISFPPFAYGHGPPFADADGPPAAIMIFFVCQLDNLTTDEKYKIVIMKERFLNKEIIYSDFEKCPSEIYFEHMPGGLSLVRNPDISSLVYIRWKDTNKNISTDPKRLDFDGGDRPSWIIDERAEGVGYGFFCVDNDWYHVAYD